MDHRTRLSLASIAVALVVVSCSSPERDAVVRTSPTPTVSGSTTPPPAPATVPTPKGWKSSSYEQAGIGFWFPPLPGQVGQGLDETADGPRYRWTIKRSDRCDPRGNCRTYEFAAVNDGCPPVSAFPTLAHRWTASKGKHSISRCEGRDPFEISPLRIVRRPDGIQGVIYDANEWFPKSQPIAGALAAVLNFPKGFHKRYEAIAFYFEDPTPLDTIETVLRLVTLDG